MENEDEKFELLKKSNYVPKEPKDSVFNIKRINTIFENSRKKFEELQKTSLEIVDIYERVKFWSGQLVEFHKYMEFNVLEASGMIADKHKHLTGEYFLDRLIKQEIAHLERCIKLDYEKEENENSETFESRGAFFEKPMELIAYIEALGVNNYLMKSQNINSKEGIGKFYFRLFNIDPNMYSKYIERIKSNNPIYDDLIKLIDTVLAKDKFKRIKND